MRASRGSHGSLRNVAGSGTMVPSASSSLNPIGLPQRVPRKSVIARGWRLIPLFAICWKLSRVTNFPTGRPSTEGETR